MSAWQPIETAPKDGTGILYADRSGYVGITYWTSCDVYSRTAGYQKQMGWFDCDDDGITRPLVGDYEPTHWMPKPDPPMT